MVSRRELITAGVVGGLSGRADTPAFAEVQSDREVAALTEVARSVDRVDATLDRALLSNSLAHGVVTKLRANMELFFRGNAKFPDFMDIGIGVFMEIYDWHVKHGQQIVVTRNADGRYWMQFMFTTLILRHEQEPLYIGIAYDRA